MEKAVLSGIILGICALLMVGIGIYQLNSKKPVAFYSGEKGPDESELFDVNAWNKKHGIMWILYGICIALAWVCGLFVEDGVLLLVPFLIGLLLPIPFMILCHHRLIEKYYIKQNRI